MYNVTILILEGLVYSLVLLSLLHFRRTIGLGVFITVLGTLHFMETYLAAAIYVETPFGTVSPGSVVLFSGKLMMILLLYVREDAPTVRQLIYGLFVGNLLAFALGHIIALHSSFIGPAGMPADFTFLGQFDYLMLWGTTLLYIDALAIILIYERLGSLIGRWTMPRIVIGGTLVLTFDTLGFYGLLHILTDAPLSVFWASLIGKVTMGWLFSFCAFLYLRFVASRRPPAPVQGINDLFGDLTYREKYEDLVRKSGYDALTGIRDRGSLESDGPKLVRNALRNHAEISLLVIDADHFKDVNDRLGHLAGDQVLRDVAATIVSTVRSADVVFRFGGEEFVVLVPDVDQSEAIAIAERIRSGVSAAVRAGDRPVTVSIGLATAPSEAMSLLELIALADKRLYRAKQDGRDRVFAGH